MSCSDQVFRGSGQQRQKLLSPLSMMMTLPSEGPLLQMQAGLQGAVSCMLRACFASWKVDTHWIHTRRGCASAWHRQQNVRT